MKKITLFILTLFVSTNLLQGQKTATAIDWLLTGVPTTIDDVLNKMLFL